MKNILTSKICLILIAVFVVQLATAQDAPPPVAPAYEKAKKETKRERRKAKETEPVSEDSESADPNKDTDNDGIIDKEDGCPEVFGIEDNYGCPETEEQKAERLKALSEENDNLFSRNVNLLELWKFLGDDKLKESQFIRKGSTGNIYTATIKFPGELESYLESVSGKLVYKSIFYRGTSTSEATAKYTEVAERITRIKQSDYEIAAGGICPLCSGIKIGFGKTYSDQTPFYFVQVVPDGNGNYEVQFIFNYNVDAAFLDKANNANTAPVVQQTGQVVSGAVTNLQFPVGSKVKVVDISNTDNLYFIEGLVGKVGKVENHDLKPLGDGWFSGPVRFYRDFYIFSKAKFERMPDNTPVTVEAYVPQTSLTTTKSSVAITKGTNVCSDLEIIIKAKTHSFEDMKIDDNAPGVLIDWRSNFVMTGADTAFIEKLGFADYSSKYLAYHAKKRNGDYPSLYSYYKNLIAQVKACSLKLPMCIGAATVTGDMETETSGTQANLVTELRIVADDKYNMYKNYTIQVGLRKDYNNKTWHIDFLVMYTGN